MKSGGFNNRDTEDKYMSGMQTGGRKVLGKFIGDNAKAGAELRRALNLNSGTMTKMGLAMGRLTRGLAKGLSPLKAILGGVIKALPKQVIAMAGIFSFSFFSFSSCGYLANDEDSGKRGAYIADDNSVSKDDEGNDEIVYSNANANVRTYYELLSQRKSVWQEYTNEEGETVLINPCDENAVSDYYKNDLNYYLDPDLLFCMNKAIFGEKSVMPEMFLKPVNYDEETYKLKPLTNGKTVVVESAKYDNDGTKSKNKSRDVSEYGLASVMKYKTETESTHFTGSYIKQDTIDEDGVIHKESINQPFDFVISSQEYHVLTNVVTFAGDISYEYTPSSTRTQSISDGESDSESAVVERYRYFAGTISFSKVLMTIVNERGVTISPATLQRLNPSFNASAFPFSKVFMNYEEALGKGYTEADIQGWITSHSMEVPYEEGKEKHTAKVSYIVQSNVLQRDVSLYKYRSSDSGVYVNFVNQSKSTVDEPGNKYLYDYLEHFACYKPSAVNRDYDTFLKMTSQASSSSDINISGKSGEGSKMGKGNNIFEQIYNGSPEGKELLETIWDICIDFGYSEIQTAAFMGNLAQESGYSTTVVNSSSGAFGMCQWLGERYTRLLDFSGGTGIALDSIELQINYACMEISPDKLYSYVDNQWLDVGEHIKYKETFKGSKNLDEVTEAICRGFERCGSEEANMSNRLSNAKSAYDTLKGKSKKHKCMGIQPIGSKDGGSAGGPTVTDTSYATRDMTETDKELFNTFFHAVDDVYNGKFVLEFFSKPLSEDEVNDILLLTNSFINGTTLADERLNSVRALWTSKYLTDLSTRKKTVAEKYGVASGKFIWAVRERAKNESSSFFGYRIPDVSYATRDHNGIDFGVDSGADVLAVCNGVISSTGYDGSMGNYVIMETEVDGHKVSMTFMHNSSIPSEIRSGAKVKQGDVIAHAGSTGASTGTHCHLQLSVDGIYTNPFIFLYGSNKQIPALDNNNKLVYIDIDTTPGSWAKAAGTEWNTYYQYVNGVYVKFNNAK